jgi:predicted ATPase
VLVVLDDLHWADRPTLQLLTHLTGLRLGRIMFVGAHRHSERPDGPLVETLGIFHRIAAITRVALHGITPQQAVEVVVAIAGREPDDAAVHLADVLHQETAGNPFYLTEMLRHLVEAGVIVELPDGRCTASAAVTSAGLPDSVREVLNARLAPVGRSGGRRPGHGGRDRPGVRRRSTGLHDPARRGPPARPARRGRTHRTGPGG